MGGQPESRLYGGGDVKDWVGRRKIKGLGIG